VLTIPYIVSYRAVGAAVFEIYNDETVRLLTAFNPGTTAADMSAAVASAEQYAKTLNMAWAL